MVPLVPKLAVMTPGEVLPVPIAPIMLSPPPALTMTSVDRPSSLAVDGCKNPAGCSLEISGGNLLAQIACLTASLCYALAGVWARRFKKLGVTPIKVASAQLIAGALVMIPVAFIVDQPWTRDLPPLEAWGAIAVLALVCSAYAYVLYFKLIDSAGATNALLVTLLVPPVAIVIGAVLLGERLSSG